MIVEWKIDHAYSSKKSYMFGYNYWYEIVDNNDFSAYSFDWGAIDSFQIWSKCLHWDWGWPIFGGKEVNSRQSSATFTVDLPLGSLFWRVILITIKILCFLLWWQRWLQWCMITKLIKLLSRLLVNRYEIQLYTNILSFQITGVHEYNKCICKLAFRRRQTNGWK